LSFGAIILAMILGKAISKAMPIDYRIATTVGAIVGAIFGIIPFIFEKRREGSSSTDSIWICAGVGAAGGGVLALPVAIFLTARIMKGSRWSNVVAYLSAGAIVIVFLNFLRNFR